MTDLAQNHPPHLLPPLDVVEPDFIKRHVGIDGLKFHHGHFHGRAEMVVGVFDPPLGEPCQRRIDQFPLLEVDEKFSDDREGEISRCLGDFEPHQDFFDFGFFFHDGPRDQGIGEGAAAVRLSPHHSFAPLRAALRSERPRHGFNHGTELEASCAEKVSTRSVK